MTIAPIASLDHSRRRRALRTWRSRRLGGIAGLVAATLAASAASAQSTRPGMGAVPFADGDGSGVTFRVWAPFASSVNLAGEFNGWNSLTLPLYSQGDGYWSRDISIADAGDRYRFVVRNGSQVLWRNDPYARDVTSSVGDSVVYDHGAFQWSDDGYSTPAWNDIVIYQLHLGTFNAGPWGPAVGTFDSATERLDDLADLGVNAIKLMPIQEFAGDRSWGYNPAHPFAVESAYGSPDEFKAFVDAAHDRGIAVLVDLVWNHLGPSDLDLWRFDGWYENDGGGIYFYNDSRSVTPWGDTRPDYGRQPVRSYIRDNVLEFLEQYRVDGVRMDGTKYMRLADPPNEPLPDGYSLLQWINDEVDARQPWKLMIAEDLDNWDGITNATAFGGAGFDSQWDARFFAPIRDVLENPSDDGRSMWAVRDAIQSLYNGDWIDRVIYTESHDEVANGRSRVPEDIWPGNADSWYSKKRSTLGGMLVMTAPGVPMIFMGQEFLEDGFFSDDDPLDWSKRETFAGIRTMYRDFIRLRRDLDGVSRGLAGPNTNVFHVNDGDKVVAFHRWDQGGEGDDVVVIANFRNQGWTNYRVGLPRAGSWKLRVNTDASVYDAEFDDHPAWDVEAEAIPWNGMPYSAVFAFGPYTGLIYSQGDVVDPGHPFDLDGDGVVSGGDLGVLLGSWGSADPTADLDDSGSVDGADLALLLGAWGETG